MSGIIEEKIRACELCNHDYYDESTDLETMTEEKENIEDTKRCRGCYEEWGDNWPDRI